MGHTQLSRWSIGHSAASLLTISLMMQLSNLIYVCHAARLIATAAAQAGTVLTPAHQATPLTISDLEQVPYIADQIHPIAYQQFEKKMDPLMQLHWLDPFNMGNNNNITCNDGTQPGYYKRLNSHSKSWIIYLQGGGYCGSEEACQQRWLTSPNLMSSNGWPKTKSVDGMLSSEPKENPYLWNANHIYVPYCSSDSWSGLTSDRTNERSFIFMGSKILERVLESLFEDLPLEMSLHEAKFILLAGDSAGATGVILNLDKVNRFVQQRFNLQKIKCALDSRNACEPKQPPILRGLADSGWFLDNEPYDYNQSEQQPSQQSIRQQQQQQFFDTNHNQQQQQQQVVSELDCNRNRCSTLQSIKQAMIHWNGQVPLACLNRYQTEPWRCYFGYRAYQTLKTPLFVVQWLYDEAQLMVGNIGRPDTNSQWNYVNKVASELRNSLENVTALFAPSCLSHSLVIKQSWNQINVNGFKLPHILNRWEEETLTNQPTFEALMLESSWPLANNYNNNNYNTNQQQTVQMREFDRLGQVAESQRSLSTNIQKISSNTRNRGRKRKRNNQHQNTNSLSITNRLSRSTLVDDGAIVFNNNVPDIMANSNFNLRVQESDKFRLIDSCGWPQCNRDCPGSDADFHFGSQFTY